MREKRRETEQNDKLDNEVLCPNQIQTYSQFMQLF